MTQFCHLLHADDAAAVKPDIDVDRQQDLEDSVSPSLSSSTAQRLDKVLDELAFTEQQYVKVQ